ncbi:MAG TPA: hydrogenase 4 subunit F [Nitrososphaerales archaeon]|nr:hydrogenase 4 subunit F [Nitrososphaerales archaeon]
MLSTLVAGLGAGAAPSGWSTLVLTVLLTPAAALVLVTLTRNRRHAEAITVFSGILVVVQTLGLVSGVISQGQFSAMGGYLYLDAFGALVLIPIAGVGFVAALYSVSYMGRQYERGVVDDGHLVRYYQGFNCFVLTMLLVPLSNNMGLMWVAIEATTLVSVFMIMLYTNQGAMEAAWKYLIVATIGLSLALLGIVLFSYANTSVSPSAAASGSALNWTSMAADSRLLDPGIVKIAFVFVLVGLGTKAGLAPMHTWLPDAHGEAPTPVSALLSGVLLNCAIYGVLRFYIVASGTLGAALPSELMIILGLLSMGIASASIYFQKDMKRMLAFSSVEHMGIVSLAVGFGGFIGFFAALLHIVNHAIAKPLLFFASGAVSQRYETKVMAEIKGVIKTMPVTGALLLVGGLAIAGMPPFNIFLSEFMVLTSGFGGGQFIAGSLMILLLVVIFAGFLRHLVPMVFGSPKGPGVAVPASERPGERGAGLPAILAMGILVVLVVVLGLYVPQPLQTLIREAVQVFGQGAPTI